MECRPQKIQSGVEPPHSKKGAAPYGTDSKSQRHTFPSSVILEKPSAGTNSKHQVSGYTPQEGTAARRYPEPRAATEYPPGTHYYREVTSMWLSHYRLTRLMAALGRRSVPACRGRRHPPLLAEELEDRTTPATIAPITFADGVGIGSLRDVILQANTNDQNNTIVLAAGTYQLTVAGRERNRWRDRRSQPHRLRLRRDDPGRRRRNDHHQRQPD